jgi:hypothetical protein
MIEEIRMENIPGTFNSDTAVSLADGTGLGVGRTSSYIVLGAVCLGVLSISTGSCLRTRLERSTYSAESTVVGVTRALGHDR